MYKNPQAWNPLSAPCAQALLFAIAAVVVVFEAALAHHRA
jgi:hypothetical protein